MEWFADPGSLALGASTGLVFGFLLQKGGVGHYRVIVDQFRLVDFTVLKIILTAIVTGSIGVFGMQALGIEIGMHVKGAQLLANALGGAIFAVGMVVLGYCPGTAMVAIGQGSRHAIAGVAGMLAGSAIFAEAYPWLSEHVIGVGDLGKITIHGSMGISPWWIVALLSLVLVFGLPRLPSSDRVGT